MTQPANSPPAAETARRLLEPGSQQSLPDSIAERLAVAWALKDLCYGAWSSEPQRTALAADALQQLAAAAQTSSASGRAEHDDELTEIVAVADWTRGIAHITRGEMALAVECFDTAAVRFRRLQQAGNAAQTQVPKIMALSMLGQYAAATDCAERARTAFVGLGDVRSAGKVSLNLGALHERLGGYAESAAESRAAAVLFARVGDRELSIMADINTAKALTSLGDFDEALRIYARSEMRAATHGFPVLEALVEEAVALIRLARGEYHEALAGFEGSRRRYEELAMPQQLAIAEKQLADAYLELRLLPEAAALFEQASARFAELNFPDERAWTFAQQGRVQALLNQPADAAALFVRAAELFEQQGIGVGHATVSLARAELALGNGEPNLALTLSAQASMGFAASDLADGCIRADVVQAHALLALDQQTAARALFASTLAQARKLHSLTVQVRCLTGKGLAALALGDIAPAQVALNEAVQLFEEQRRALPGDDLRTAFLGDHLRPYEALLRIALAEHAQSPTPARARAATVLRQLDRVRARALDERLRQSAAREHNPTTQRLRERLNWLYRRVQRMDEEGASSAALTQELRSAEVQLLEQARRARIASGTAATHGEITADAGSGDDDFDIAALQAVLGPNDALIEYGVQDDELFACVLTPTGVSLLRNLAAWSEVLEALRAARFQIETLCHGDAPVQQHMATLTRRANVRMQQLHALVWAPLRSALADCQRVLVVPHGQLGWLPFAALQDGDTTLIEQFELAVVPSARLALRGYLRQPTPPRQAVVLGESSRLPHAAVEANFIAGLFDNASAFTGEQATLATLQAHAGNADVVHLACHAQFRTDNPMFSALHLFDAPLTVELAETLNLRPGVVVLSACETGRAQLGSGDEMVGLVRAFLIAGTARVLASGWPIDDQHTARFMTSFYAALCRGEAPATALRAAQLDARQASPHPAHWATFSLYGGF